MSKKNTKRFSSVLGVEALYYTTRETNTGFYFYPIPGIGD